MKEFLLKFPFIYRLYQKTVRGKNHEYFFFEYIFKKLSKKKIRMLDLCCGDSHVLNYTEKYISDYLGFDNNHFYLKQNKKKWRKYNFIFGDLKNLEMNKEILKFNPNLIFMNGALQHLDNNLINMVNKIVKKKFKNAIFISVDPIKEKNKILNKLMIYFDRGKFIRSKKNYEKLMKEYDTFIIDDFYTMSFLNIFHYRNFKLKDYYFKWRSNLNN